MNMCFNSIKKNGRLLFFRDLSLLRIYSLLFPFLIFILCVVMLFSTAELVQIGIDAKELHRAQLISESYSLLSYIDFFLPLQNFFIICIIISIVMALLLHIPFLLSIAFFKNRITITLEKIYAFSQPLLIIVLAWMQSIFELVSLKKISLTPVDFHFEINMISDYINTHGLHDKNRILYMSWVEQFQSTTTTLQISIYLISILTIIKIISNCINRNQFLSSKNR